MNILVCDDEALIRSLIKEYCPGYLDAVVGGVVGDGEDANLCAEREIGKEIGIDINNIYRKIKIYY